MFAVTEYRALRFERSNQVGADLLQATAVGVLFIDQNFGQLRTNFQLRV
jgi:hypothetical protein